MASVAKTTNEELLVRLRSDGDSGEVIAQLWENNQGLVKLIVRKTTGLTEREEGFEDMLQQAFFGFRAAAYAYDPERGNKFSSFAARCIEWELIKYHERNGYTTRIPGYMRRRFRDCITKKRQMEAESGHRVSNRAALEAMGFSPAVVASTLAAFRKLETVSLDTPQGSDEAGASLMDLLVAGDDLENVVLGQKWHEELHELLFTALRELPEIERGILIRRYFSGVSFERQAQELGVTKQAVGERAHKAYKAIRAGRYGPALAEFMPSESAKARADRLLRETREAIAKLNLGDGERGLLAL
jgi:RNA polymerase sigma factor (sigma-70 family)